MEANAKLTLKQVRCARWMSEMVVATLKRFEKALERSITTQVLNQIQQEKQIMRNRRQSAGDVVKKRFFEYQYRGWQKCERALAKRKVLQIQDLDADQQIELLEEVSLKEFQIGGKSTIDAMEAYETIIDGEHAFMVRVYTNAGCNLFRYHPSSERELDVDQKSIPDKLAAIAQDAQSIMHKYLVDTGLVCDC